MPVNLEWSVPHQIVSPRGTIILNGPGNDPLSSGAQPIYLLKPNPYSVVPSALRRVSDVISQADGESLQPPWIGGMAASLYLEYWIANPDSLGPPDGDGLPGTPACAQDLREIDQRIMLVLNGLRTFSTDPAALQRLMWTPEVPDGDPSVPDRMLTDILLAAWPAPVWFGNDGIGAGITFGLATPFPYAVENDEVSTPIADGGSAAIANEGSAEYSPVVRVSGATSDFTITNNDTGEVVTYDASRPGAAPIGGGDFADIDFFQGSIYLNGDPTMSLIAGLDPNATIFFTLAPDDTTTIAADGADIDVYSRGAYA